MTLFNQDKDYIKRVNLALSFIDTHLNSNVLSLESISEVASFSPFHFHRIFKIIIGETLNSYINRKRLEQAAAALIHKKDLTVTEIAMQSGFSSNSSFSRAFKKFYAVSPSVFRTNHPHKFSKISTIESKNGQEKSNTEQYICNINNHLNWVTMYATIEIKTLPELHLASVTHIGVNNIENAFERIIKWAIPQGLMQDPETKLVRLFHDSFKITTPDKVRMSIGVLTEKDFLVDADIQKTSTTPGKYIVGHFEIPIEDFEKSWNSLYIWMHDNGYKKAEGAPFEIYQNDMRQHPEGLAVVDFHIPIV
ncbi:GyrI-like domain-containing protein [Algibacter miyuki]|uniref:GyrI-like domain-containing protein n=1 Tax=Algibacter miyuki TaxID=1306933 RepID=A0ABV5GVC6_9FLAO|nr:AraC family transcriptional regulator [Algibacter miyuki]MDN3664778.1 AraC family transcriptional regulator [Algibacter miyuki]